VIYGQISILIALLTLVGAAFWLCVRTRAVCDATARDNQDVREKIMHALAIAEAAKSIAAEALATVKGMYTEHFDSLAAQVKKIQSEASTAVAKADSLGESLRDVSLKFDARLRRGRKEKPLPEIEDEDEIPGEGEDNGTGTETLADGGGGKLRKCLVSNPRG